MRYVPAIAIAVAVCTATCVALFLTRDVSSLNGLWGLLLAVWAANATARAEADARHDEAFWSREKRTQRRPGGDDVEV